MSSDWNDPVYDEYLSTGIDPTGGDIGPDFDLVEDDMFEEEDPIDIQRARQFIDSHIWHFAKTMPDIPHWYCLLKDKGDVEEFRWFAAYIREHSVPGQFYGKTYYYYYLDGYKYWWMDATVEECDLINRDKVQ